MNIILYHIISFLFTSFLFLFTGVYFYNKVRFLRSKSSKNSRKQKDVDLKRRKYLQYMFGCVIAFLIFFSGALYYGLDYYVGDYVKAQGVYIGEKYDRNVLTTMIVMQSEDVTLELDVLHSEFREYQLEIGTKYEFIYGKRTKGILDISPIQ